MTLHDRIMNIQGEYNPTEPQEREYLLCYKTGHRDARHAAAELSLKYDMYIDMLEDLIQDSSIFSKFKKECGL